MENKIKYNPVQTTPFELRIKLKSHFWKLINSTVFRWFPNQIKKPRVVLLTLFGAKLANTVNVSRTAVIDHPWNLTMGHLSSLGDNSWTYCLDTITIGDKCCIGKDVYLLTSSHDVHDLSFKQTFRPIIINDGCWVATGAYIMPGVTLGSYTIVGAKSLVVKDTAPYSIVGGNPAKVLKKRDFKI